MLMTIVSKLTKTRLMFGGLILVLLFLTTINDPDYFWHLKTGEYIVLQRALPVGDIFSSRHLGQPWVLHEWLFEVALYLMFAWLGTLGVKLFTVTLAVFTLGMLFLLMQRISRSPTIAVALLLTVLGPFAIGISPRPQLITYFCFCFFLFVLVSYKYFDAGVSLWLLPLLMVVWVNAHGGYVIGIALIGIFTVCEWVGYWSSFGRDLLRRKGLVRLAQVACATVAASLINPGHFERWLYPFEVLGMAANEHIQEWQSPNFHGFIGKWYLLLVLLFVFSYIYAKCKPDLTEAVVPTFFLVNGFLATRHIPLAVLAMVPFIALALRRCEMSRLIDRLRGTYLAKMYKNLIGRGPELGQSEFVLNWALLAGIGIALSIYASTFAAQEDVKLNEMLPVNAANFVLANGISGNLFNTYHYGGYLIYRFSSDRKVLIDGRADMYGDKFIADFLHIYNGNENWKNKFRDLSIDYAILSIDAPIRQLLREEASFVEVYSDPHHSVLLRNSAKYKSILDRLQK